MIKALMKQVGIFIVMIMCFILTALPLWASILTPDIEAEPEVGDSALRTSEEAIPYYKKFSVTELYDKVKECRQSLLETRMDVVKEANEAKLRLESILKNSKPSAQTTEVLRKDLDTIKEAQRVLATILSDIVNATSREGLDVPESVAPQIGMAGSGTGANLRQETIVLPSREYLESLVVLYDDKTQQLAKIVESLYGIAVLVN